MLQMTFPCGEIVVKIQCYATLRPLLNYTEFIERAFMLWLYSGKLMNSNEDATSLDPLLLARLYIFEDTHSLPDLRNAALDALETRVDLISRRPFRYQTAPQGSAATTGSKISASSCWIYSNSKCSLRCWIKSLQISWIEMNPQPYD